MASKPAGPDFDDVTVMFHLSESEMVLAETAMNHREPPVEMEPGSIYAALLEEIDKIVPAAKLVEKAAQGEVIGLAVLRKGQAMPDSRFQRTTHDAPWRTRKANGAPATAGVAPLAAARIDPRSSMGAKMAIVPMTPFPPERVAELKDGSEQAGIPYPTHQGVISLDGKTELKVYQLSDGQRVVDAQDLHRFFARFGGV